MTAVESLPGYAEAEAMAEKRGTNLLDLLSAFMAGYAKGAEPDYMSDDVLPGEVVCHTPEETRALMDAIISGASRG